ncbi:MAG: manganese efflux pump [Deltaproteobacteria bacterium]|nr:manganese efflux pump [Deltaproteobacteria bacterium]
MSLIGQRFENICGKRMEAIGGITLIAIGIKILVEHLAI